MGRKRRTFSASFKAKVALAAAKGDRTLAELASQHGVYPTLFDDRVLTALITLAHREHGFESNRVHTTRYEIARILQRAFDGRSSKRIFGSAEKLCEVRYRSDNAWWDDAKKTRTLKDRFGLLDRGTWDEDRGGGRYSKSERENAFYVFGDKLYENLKEGFVRHIDFNIANRLQTFVAYDRRKGWRRQVHALGQPRRLSASRRCGGS